MLVVLGYFFQSMIKSGILQANGVYGWFETTIYYFHVPLFFICSVDEGCFAESGHRKRDIPCDGWTHQQFCGTDDCSMDDKENKVVGVFYGGYELYKAEKIG